MRQRPETHEILSQLRGTKHEADAAVLVVPFTLILVELARQVVAWL